MKAIPGVFLVLGLSASAWAQDQQLGARTKGMGGSYTAFEDDPVSVWLNPAGISTQPNQLALSYQTYTTYPLNRELTGPGTLKVTGDAETTFVDPAFIPSYLGLVFQVGSADNPMAIGVCYARPYHLNYSFDKLEDPAKTVFTADTNIEQSLGRFRAAFAKDFRFRPAGEPGFFNRLAVGGGLDIGYEQWRFEGEGGSITDTSTALGFGLGILLGVYDNFEDFKINFGAAYQSPVRWSFSNDPKAFPQFDMPQQINLGLTGYFLQGTPLRVTFDLQFVEWSKTAERPAFPGRSEFEDAVNFSFGVEYRIKAAEKTSLYPRAGYRRFNAPWKHTDDLPMTGSYLLMLDTKASAFNIGTAGLGVSFTDEKGRLWAIDLGVDFGGDTFNVALGFTYEI
jgi:long-subunit fatty acid transport protein